MFELRCYCYSHASSIAWGNGMEGKKLASNNASIAMEVSNVNNRCRLIKCIHNGKTDQIHRTQQLQCKWARRAWNETKHIYEKKSWCVLIHDGGKWFVCNDSIISIDFFCSFLLRLFYCVLNTHASRVKEYLCAKWERIVKRKKKHPIHTHKWKNQVWCNQKSKVFETRSRILYKHTIHLFKSRDGT